jgi:glycolate oxidase FAD binding subunit
LIEAAQIVLSSELLPGAVEILSPGNLVLPEIITSDQQHTLLVRFAGMNETVSYQVKRAIALIESVKSITTSTIFDDAGLWADLAAIPVRHNSQLVWRAVVPRTKIETLLNFVIKQNGDGSSLLWQASVGDGRLRVEEDAGAGNVGKKITSLEELRRTAISLGGYLAVENAPLYIKEEFDMWGDAGNAAPVMFAIKAQLDSEDIFSPGRFVAGI